MGLTRDDFTMHGYGQETERSPCSAWELSAGSLQQLRQTTQAGEQPPMKRTRPAINSAAPQLYWSAS